MVLNAHHDQVGFTLPECAGGARWTLLIDTNQPAGEGARREEGAIATGETYDVTARSLLLLALQPDGG